MGRIKSPAVNQQATAKILNDLRQYTPASYQSAIPEITVADEVPKVCDMILGSNALVTAVCGGLAYGVVPKLVRMAEEANPYASLDKGFHDPSDTIEEIYIGLVNALPYSTDKASAREFKRYEPNVKTAFHAVNWKVLYPITVDPVAVRGALKGYDLSDFVAGLVASIYKSAYNDHRLLVKYMLIKSMSHGLIPAIATGAGATTADYVKKFRGASNKFRFLSNKYNMARVDNDTPVDRQVIFMDGDFNADYDVDVLASAFNMDKATFIGRLYLMDDWTSFDNARFAQIRAESDGLEEVTATELALLANVKAILLDEDWFQIYQSVFETRTQQSASGLYDNYFLHDWKIISKSPFANAVMFVNSSASIGVPDTITATVTEKKLTADGVIITVNTTPDTPALTPANVTLVQTEQATTNGVVVVPYGMLIIPSAKTSTALTLKATIDNTGYTASATVTGAGLNVGSTITFNKDV